MRPTATIVTGDSFSAVVDNVRTYPQIRWVCSDIDGTLLSPLAVVDLYVAAARRSGIDIDESHVLPWLGKIPIQDPLAAATTLFDKTQASTDTIASVIREYETAFSQAPADYFQRFVYPDIPIALQELSTMGVGLAIISNRYEALALHQLTGTEIGHFVGRDPGYPRTQELTLCGGDTPVLEVGQWPEGKAGQLAIHLYKLAISPGEALVVGDQFDSDMAAARALKISGIHLQRTT